MPLNPRYGDGELREIVAAVGCAALVSVARECMHRLHSRRLLACATENVAEPAQILLGVTATGAYGSAATLLALAMGASRVVALGRNTTALAALEAFGRSRLVTVAATGQPQTDCEAIHAAANGRVDLAFDMVGGARDPNMTLAALRSLRREGRLVLMGSMTADLPFPIPR
ncbi:zinc-binding dehydrogenase [Paraburkholderia flagellata]|uniref:zinc-binding dehydrogenase n=1 Tax=Paraburkholderia flagellata TaxID=2883241 RepID=UPI001F47E071|nr:zinc-binding dehydrogenase [Paraburkholderia flagellata]